MQVHCDKGLADRIDTEPCAGIREGASEASAGEHVGQPLSRESYSVLGADAVLKAEGHTAGRAMASVSTDPTWSKTLACMDAPCAGTGRSAVHPAGSGAGGSHREGEEP